MNIRQFIRENRVRIDAIVLEYYNKQVSNDYERHEWILNDRGLYEWAQQEGVNI